MKSLSIYIYVHLILFLISGTLYADYEDTEKTLSPYFLVNSGSNQKNVLPLLSTRAKINIIGVIADVTVEQVYHNTGSVALEAIYVFPASLNAAVYGMSMQIGSRLVVAEIQEKEKARRTYEDAKRQGRSASLLEQKRPNVFQMNVANIMPGDSIIVTLMYTELLVPESGTYEFVCPTVVGPRYTEGSSKDEDVFESIPYGNEDEEALYEFGINIQLSGIVPIDNVESKTHQINIDTLSDSKFEIVLDDSELFAGNRDFILRFRLSGGKIHTGLFLSEGQDENFFLLMLQPPKAVNDQDIPPREYLFVLDVSGSMFGYPLDVAKDLIFDLLDGLREDDKFNVLLFAGGSKVIFRRPMPVTEENIEEAKDIINSQQGGGGTNLLPALQKALSMRKKSNCSKSIVVITDGFVSVEKEAYTLIRKRLNDANVFTFGIGSSVNRFLIESLARAGNGKAFVVTESGEADEKAEEFVKYISSPVLSNIRVKFDEFNTYDIEPKSIPDVFAARPILIYGKWKYPLKGKITITGITGDDKYKIDIPITQSNEIDTGKALTYLWARNRLSILSDYSTLRDEHKSKQMITDLGLKYNLLTNYTSFVAVDYEIRNKGKHIETIHQPVPLPEGVSERALASRSSYSGSTSSGYSVGSVVGGIVGGFFGGGFGGNSDDPLCPGASYEKIFLGPMMSYISLNMTNIPFVNNTYIPNDKFDRATLNGFSFGLSYEDHIGKIETTTSSLIFNLIYSTVTGEFNKDIDNYELKNSGENISVEAEYISEYSLSYLNFDVLYKQNLMQEIPLGFVGGLSFGIPTKINSTERFRLKSDDPIIRFPGDSKPEADGKSILLNGGDKKDIFPVSLNLVTGMQYEIIPGEGFYLIPWVYYHYGILKIFKNDDTRANYLDYGLAVRFAL